MFKERIKAVIFDFDNTLVDEEFWIEERWKKTMPFAENDLQLENFGKHFWRIFKEKGRRYKYHVNDTLKAINKNQALAEPIVNHFLLQTTDERLCPGAVNCLDFLKHRFKLGIVTNGKREIQIKRIKRANLYNFFDAIICAYDNPKPSLQPYIECMQKLGVCAEEAIYIGDDPEIDLAGAKKIGMTTVCFSPENIVKSKGGDMHIKAYSELVKIFKE